MGNFYLGNTELNQTWLGNTLISKTTGYESQVPTTVVSSSFVDMMIAPYVSSSINNGQLIELYAGGRVNTGSFSISGNAIEGFTNLSPSPSTPGTGSFSILSIEYNNSWFAEENQVQLWDGWIFASASTWDTGGSPAAGDILSFSFGANDTNRLGGGTNSWTTRNTAGTATVFNPFNANFSTNDQDQSSWNGQWVYFIASFQNVGGVVPTDEQQYRLWWKTKAGVTGSAGINFGSNPLAQSNLPTYINLYGIPGMKWGVFRHYYEVDYATNDGFGFINTIGLVNFEAEKNYFS